MKFAPKTDKEIAEMNLWQPGEYGFEIVEATSKTSKAGNEMIELEIRVFNDEGSSRTVTDYLMEKLAYKLKHAAVACGLQDKYEQGFLDDVDFVGKTGKLKLKVTKDKNGQYPDKNDVADYIVPKNAQDAAPSFINDTIPF